MLRPLITDPRIEVGEFSYYDDRDDATAFQERNVLYMYGPEKLVIGKYCALATGTRFIMAGANHPDLGVSTFPFTIFGGEWADRTLDIMTGMQTKGDTVVGNDVWIGYESVIMPGSASATARSWRRDRSWWRTCRRTRSSGATRRSRSAHGLPTRTSNGCCAPVGGIGRSS